MTNDIKKIVFLTILLSLFFVDEPSAFLGVSTEGASLKMDDISSVGRVVNGLSLSLGNPLFASEALSNEPLDEMNGISISLVPPSGRFNGISINLSGEFSKGGITGLAVGPYAVWGGDLVGIFVGAGIAAEDLTGIAVGGVLFSERVNGIEIGLLIRVEEKITGVAIAVLNRTKHLSGVQIGLVNYAEVLYGVQIGLINYAGNNPKGLQWLPLINIHF